MADELTAEQRLLETRTRFAVLETKLSFEAPELQAKYAELFDAGDADTITVEAVKDKLISETK